MDWKSYATQSGAIAAIRKAGLQNVPHRFSVILGNRIRPEFTPGNDEDVAYLTDQGWFATKVTALSNSERMDG